MIATHQGGRVVEWAPLATFFDQRSPVDQVPWNRWRYTQNMRVDRRYGWGVRSGFRRFGHDARVPENADLNQGLGAGITSLYSHLRPDGSKILIAGSSTAIARFVPDGRWVTLGTLAEGGRPVFTSVNDVVIVTNGADFPRYWIAGETAFREFAELDDIGVSRVGVVGSWNGVLFFGDLTMDGTRVGHRLLWSDVNNPLALAPSATRVSGFQDLDAGSTIRAIIPLSDVLFVFTDKSIWRVSAVGGDEQYGFQRVYLNPDGEGLPIGTHAICNAKNSAVYLAWDGMYIFNPFASIPEKVEWMERGTKRISVTECDYVTTAYNPEFDEIRVSYTATDGVKETVCFNWATQSSDILDHGFSAMLATTVDTSETFYEWLIRVAGCSIGTYDEETEVYTGLADLWPELQPLVTETLCGGEPCDDPPASYPDPPLEVSVYLYPYAMPNAIVAGCPYLYLGAGNPADNVANVQDIYDDLEAYAQGLYPEYTFGAPQWEYEVASGSATDQLIQGWNIGLWLPDGLGSMSSGANTCTRIGAGWKLKITGTLGVPEIVLKYGAAEIPCGSAASATYGTEYGSTPVGTAVSRTFTVENRGSASLTGVSVTVPTGYVLDLAPDATIVSGGSDTFTVRLAAEHQGRYDGKITIRSNDSDEDPCELSVSGYVSGAPEVEVWGTIEQTSGSLVSGERYWITDYNASDDFSNVGAASNATDVTFTATGTTPTTWTNASVLVRGISDGDSAANTQDGTDFGTVAIGAPVTHEFTIRNTGTARLTLSPLRVPNGYEVLIDLPAYIEPDGEFPFRVRLKAEEPGTYAGDIAFDCNDEDESTFNFAITGTVEPNDDHTCESIPSGTDCATCTGSPVFLGVSTVDGCIKVDADVYYRELRSGDTYLQSTYSSILRTGCLSFDSREGKRLQKVSFDVIADTTASLTGTVYRSSVPTEITGGCTVKSTTLSARTLACSGSESHPYWTMVLDSRYFTFDFRITTVTGPVWFSRLGIEIGVAPVSLP